MPSPVMEYSWPLAISGVSSLRERLRMGSSLNARSGEGERHATRSCETFSLLIWSSGEYFWPFTLPA